MVTSSGVEWCGSGCRRGSGGGYRFGSGGDEYGRCGLLYLPVRGTFFHSFPTLFTLTHMGKAQSVTTHPSGIKLHVTRQHKCNVIIATSPLTSRRVYFPVKSTGYS